MYRKGGLNYMKKLLIILGLIITFIQLHSQKVILFFLMLFAFGCFKVQEKNCQDTREGMIVVLEKPYNADNGKKIHAEFFPLINDSIQYEISYFVTNKLPKEYALRDSMRVFVSYASPFTPTGQIHITCIEKVKQ